MGGAWCEVESIVERGGRSEEAVVEKDACEAFGLRVLLMRDNVSSASSGVVSVDFFFDMVDGTYWLP